MHAAWQKGDIRTAMSINEKLMPINDAMFCETSPGPVKFALSLLGHGTSELRLPMAPIAEASRAKVEAAMKKVGLIGQ
jgi:4-hydroxy-tetrahydrodipicolinate synthase